MNRINSFFKSVTAFAVAARDVVLWLSKPESAEKITATFDAARKVSDSVLTVYETVVQSMRPVAQELKKADHALAAAAKEAARTIKAAVEAHEEVVKEATSSVNKPAPRKRGRPRKSAQ